MTIGDIQIIILECGVIGPATKMIEANESDVRGAAAGFLRELAIDRALP